MVDDCTAALELNPRYVKALLRRAQANESLEKYDVALEGEPNSFGASPAVTLLGMCVGLSAIVSYNTIRRTRDA